MTTNKITGRDEIATTIHFATNKHKNQPRKDKVGTPYIVHPIFVFSLLTTIGGISDLATLIAAILHDILEDTATTGIEIEKLFHGHLGVQVYAYVLECTDDKSLPKKVRKKKQIEHAPHLSTGAKLIKLADKIANVADLIHNKPNGWTVKRVNKYFDWAEQVVAGLRGVNAPLEAHFDHVLAQARAKYSNIERRKK